MIARVPHNRPGEAEEVAAASLYFASDESRFTTRTELRIDGGLKLL
jgi:NAD(P)-dependent dehydrogenase (short-subunit alcohol dehydrogenase family)